MRAQDRQRLVHGELEDVRDAAPVEQHLERLAVVAPAPTGLAAHVHVGQEVHADGAHSVALAGLAAPALDVEGEAARLVAARTRFRHQREEVADEGEGPGVGGRIGARRAADRALVDGHHLVDGFRAFQGLVTARLGGRPVEPPGQGAIQDVFHQRRLARTAHARHRRDHAERDLDVDVPQVVLPGALDAEDAFGNAAHGGNGDGKLATEIAPGQAAVDGARRALVHEAATLPARPFAEVEDPVRGPDRLLVVFDHDDGVAEVADAGERRQQALVVALVQADGRLVQDVEDALHAAADLAGQPDAMGLSARERGGGPIQGQVADTHGVEEAQARQDLRQQALRHRLLARLERQRGEGPDRFRHGQADELRDGAVAQTDGQALRTQAGSLAVGAGRLHEIGPDVVEGLAAVRGRSRLFRRRGVEAEEGLRLAAQIGEHPWERPVSLEQGLARPAGQLGERDLEGEAEALGQLVERPAPEARAVTLPRMDGAVHERLVLVRMTARRPRPNGAEPFAQRAGAVGLLRKARAQLGEDTSHRAQPASGCRTALLADRDHHHVAGGAALSRAKGAASPPPAGGPGGRRGPRRRWLRRGSSAIAPPG